MTRARFAGPSLQVVDKSPIRQMNGKPVMEVIPNTGNRPASPIGVYHPTIHFVGCVVVSGEGQENGKESHQTGND